MDELLTDGGMVRKLWLGEAKAYRDHLLRLDPDSRRNRFGGAAAGEVIEAYAASAMRMGAVMHGFLIDGVLRGVAELRPFGTAFPTEAEVAFSIEKPWQSHGVGSVLLERTLLAARNRGIKLVHMACLADNARMQQLARKFEAELSFDMGSVIGEVAAPQATPLSVFREMVADGHGFATAVLDVQARMLRPA
jgi:GNAT superfamily N-acetyltransferase